MNGFTIEEIILLISNPSYKNDSAFATFSITNHTSIEGSLLTKRTIALTYSELWIVTIAKFV